MERIREIEVAGRKVRVRIVVLANGGVRGELVGVKRAPSFTASDEDALLAIVRRAAIDCQPVAGPHWR